MITYADIQRIYRLEKNSPTLQEVPKEFYSEIPLLLAGVEDEHRDYITKLVVEIYERRRNKIVLQALRTLDESTAPERILPEEEDVYAAVVRTLGEHKKKTLLERIESKTVAEKKREERAEEKKESKIKVRILRPMPSITGVDLITYGPFKIDDIVELPEDNALALLKQDIVERID